MNETVRIPRRCAWGVCGHYDRMHYDSAFQSGRTCGYEGAEGQCPCEGFRTSAQDRTFPPNESIPPMPVPQQVLIG